MLWEDNYLVHYGIKGQHWGIRRFQNKDGSLTSEGRERYYRHLDKEDKLDNERSVKAPEELKFHVENKKSFYEKAKAEGQSEAEVEAWYNARKKALEDEIKYISRDKVFNKKMRKFLDKNQNITLSDLRKAIAKNAKKAKLESNWVKKYYDEHLDSILGKK